MPKLPLPNPGAALAAMSATGPNDILWRIGNQTVECPDEKFALVGYSQGGGVVYRAATLLKAKPELANKVLAVVLYGASDGTQLALPPKTVLANCARGDIVSAAVGHRDDSCD
jgi:cutinase